MDRTSIFYDISNNDFEISTNVGINQISKNNPVGLSVWPNPFTNQLNLSAGNLKSESITDLKIIDVLGKSVYQSNFLNKTELNETLDLSGLSAGVYFISITNNNNQAVYRIIKN